MSNEFSLLTVCLLPGLIGLFSFIDRWNHRTYTIISVLGGLVNLSFLYSLKQKYFQTSLLILNFSVDGYGYLLSILVSVCWIITAIYSHGYLKLNYHDKRPSFYAFLSFTISTVITTGFSNSIFTTIIFYTISSFAILYLLHNFKIQNQHIEKTYILSVIMPPILVLMPLCDYYGILYPAFQELSIQALHISDFEASLLLAAIIILFSKNCVMPFHAWLPASSFAPAPLSALIHTVGAVQTGIIAIIKITTQMYTLPYLAHLHENFYLTGWISYLCGVTALYTAYCAWKTTNIKKRFSYSTVGQLSYVITAILVGTHISLVGALLHVVTHSFAKMSLFFSAGILSVSYKSRTAKEVNKVIPKIPWLIIIMSSAGLSIAGVPLLAGYHSKDLMLLEEVHTKHFGSAFFLLCGSFVNLLYILPIVKVGVKAYYPKRKYSLEEIKETQNKIEPSMKFATVCSFLLLIAISISLDVDSEHLVQLIFDQTLHIE